jgi:hypothetical protein
MASSSSVPKRVLVVDLTIDEDVNKCLAGVKRITREREATVVVEKKQKSCEPEKKVDYDEDELVEDLIRALRQDLETAGDCLRFALEHYAPDPELTSGVTEDPFVHNAEAILNDMEQFCCF